MTTIYLLEPSTRIFKTYELFRIERKSHNNLKIRIREIDRILLFGNVQLSTPVINSCFYHNIPVLFLTQLGEYRGHLWNYNSIDLNLHSTQFYRINDRFFKYNLSRAILLGKLINSRQLLMRFNRRRKLADLSETISGLAKDIQAIESSNNIEQLLGYEGIAAARYFSALGTLISNSTFSFSKRTRCPPTDPVNSLLSFGYTILCNNVLSLIISQGLSPYFGNLHHGEIHKPFLAFDLMEEFRSAIVDSFVLKIINNAWFKLDDFNRSSNGGFYLNKTARRHFINYFETRMNEQISHPDSVKPVSYRQAIDLQIKRYKQTLISNLPYQPFLRAK